MFERHHSRTGCAELNVTKAFLLITLYSSLMPTCLLKTKVVHGKHFVIHVPMKIRTHHHTHTVYTQVHGGGSKESKSGAPGGGGYGGGGGSKQTIYKIMGYSTHHSGLATGSGSSGGGGGGGMKVIGHHHRHHGHSHGYRYNRGVGCSSYGEINYDDYIDCDNSQSYSNRGGGGGGGSGGGGGDMIFNHFSRLDEEDYPDVEEFIDDDEIGDEWE